jgi:prepilin-type N-terminal cleavage/methylation domain-containing protein
MHVSGTGRLFCRHQTRGFTLLEILLALALMVLLLGVLVTASIQLTDKKALTAEEVFWQAVRESREQALLSGLDVRLRFVNKEKTRALVASSIKGEEKYPLQGANEETVIDFLSAQKSSSAILIRSQLVETSTIPFVTFYGDGTCTPFRVQFRVGGQARSLTIDPWTCAPVLQAGEKRG